MDDTTTNSLSDENSNMNGTVGAESDASALECIRRHCVSCVGSKRGVRDCGGDTQMNRTPPGPCWLFPWRFGHRPENAAADGEDVRGERLTPVKCIHQECLSCVGGSEKELMLCASLSCELWRFRFGVRPDKARRMGHIVDKDKFVKVRTEPEKPGGPNFDWIVLPDGRKIKLAPKDYQHLGRVAAARSA